MAVGRGQSTCSRPRLEFFPFLIPLPLLQAENSQHLVDISRHGGLQAGVSRHLVDIRRHGGLQAGISRHLVDISRHERL